MWCQKISPTKVNVARPLLQLLNKKLCSRKLTRWNSTFMFLIQRL
jgi:hypothetical protein